MTLCCSQLHRFKNNNNKKSTGYKKTYMVLSNATSKFLSSYAVSFCILSPYYLEIICNHFIFFVKNMSKCCAKCNGMHVMGHAYCCSYGLECCNSLPMVQAIVRHVLLCPPINGAMFCSKTTSPHEPSPPLPSSTFPEPTLSGKRTGETRL